MIIIICIDNSGALEARSFALALVVAIFVGKLRSHTGIRDPQSMGSLLSDD
jgi:hypothetical protein